MANVAHLSTPDLIRRMQNAGEDQNLDDETAELSKRLDKRGETFRWKYIGGLGYRIVVEPKSKEDDA